MLGRGHSESSQQGLQLIYKLLAGKRDGHGIRDLVITFLSGNLSVTLHKTAYEALDNAPRLLEQPGRNELLITFTELGEIYGKALTINFKAAAGSAVIKGYSHALQQSLYSPAFGRINFAVLRDIYCISIRNCKMSLGQIPSEEFCPILSFELAGSGGFLGSHLQIFYNRQREVSSFIFLRGIGYNG